MVVYGTNAITGKTEIVKPTESAIATIKSMDTPRGRELWEKWKVIAKIQNLAHGRPENWGLDT